MRTLPPVLIAAMLAATPAMADDHTMEQRLQNHLGESLEKFMDEMQKMGPALDDAMDQMVQFLGAFEQVDDLRNYTRPEILPNGDIIIRRDPDAPPYQPPAPAPAPATPEAQDNSDTVDL